MSVTIEKPMLFKGDYLPLGKLNSDQFEDFIYQSLIVLGKTESHKFSMENGPQNSSDNGFDCVGKNKENRVICFQCKRYASALSLSDLATEIAKVALNDFLNNSTTVRHYIITSGAVQNKTRVSLRENNHSELKNECYKKLSSSSFETIVGKCKSKVRTVDLQNLINSYIDGLNKLIVWSGRDFTNELTIVWSKLGDILSRNFQLEQILLDNRIPDFNVRSYFKINHSNNNLAPLSFIDSKLPNNLCTKHKIFTHGKERIITIKDIVSFLCVGENIILSSLGGSGKSSTLQMVIEEFSKIENEIEYLPIKIRLRSYSRNNLDYMITQALNTKYGSWRCLPFKFVILLDGLDEMLEHDTQALIDELNHYSEDCNFIVTLRNTGLSIKTELFQDIYCFSILPLSYRDMFYLSGHKFKDQNLKEFNDEYRKFIGQNGYGVISLPLGIDLALKYYEENNQLPVSVEKLFDTWIDNRLEDNERRAGFVQKAVSLTPVTIKEIFSLFLYFIRIEQKMICIDRNKYDATLIEAIKYIKDKRNDLSEFLTYTSLNVILKHYDFLYLEDTQYHFNIHMVIQGYLLSKPVSQNWEQQLDNIPMEMNEDIWLYVGNYISEKEKEVFLNEALNNDPVLGAKISKKFGSKYIDIAEKYLLEAEQSKRVITRSLAIYALGLLDTSAALERLRSRDKYIDREHSDQRLRSLALNGDKATLISILEKNEGPVSSSIDISGGTYDHWFSAPPEIIIDIARKRLIKWCEIVKKGTGSVQRIPICMSIKTMEVYGDYSDIDLLINILSNTKDRAEFNFTCNALMEIDQNRLEKKLRQIINNGCMSYPAKVCLFSMGVKPDISKEFEEFIVFCQDLQNQQINGSVYMTLNNFVEFVSQLKLSDDQINTLVETYKIIRIKYDTSICCHVWRLAHDLQLVEFLEIVDLAFTDKNTEEILSALYYLSNLSSDSVSQNLIDKIDEHLDIEVGDSEHGLLSSYVKYYINIDRRDRAIEIAQKSISRLLRDKSPKTIDRDEYISSLSAFNIFNFLDDRIIKDIALSESIALNFLLINTDSSPQFNEAKRIVLSNIKFENIESFTESIVSQEVKIYIYKFLLFNCLVPNPLLLMKRLLPIFIGNHFFYPTIESVCTNNWDDDLAEIFLNSFCYKEWGGYISLFHKYINFFSNRLTKTQLYNFETTRRREVNIQAKRIYSIWLETNKVDIPDLDK
jgi:hypothetical protein